MSTFIQVGPRAGSYRRRILEFIAQAGKVGLTDDEGAAMLDLYVTSYVAARWSLVQSGFVRDGGRRRDTKRGNPAVAWVLTEGGRKHWERVQEARSEK